MADRNLAPFPDALYTAAKRDNNSSPDNRPLYENIKPNKDDNRNEASLVYASLVYLILFHKQGMDTNPSTILHLVETEPKVC
ncbi:hypothetical protein CEXT_93941 [Caerostris extrusa]|uniref:Uncharacterized protein n=1 Tax=Caerostris extrusa TaxID=172846 RepID=A0AAV4U7H3_CAEEX|nr:hypothetical protein CEXT_93941 [Caerostris extrusa]